MKCPFKIRLEGATEDCCKITQGGECQFKSEDETCPIRDEYTQKTPNNG